MAMKRVLLGKSGIEVSELCLGTMQFGPSCDEAEAERIISAALERGANFRERASNAVNVSRAIVNNRDHVEGLRRFRTVSTA